MYFLGRTALEMFKNSSKLQLMKQNEIGQDAMIVKLYKYHSMAISDLESFDFFFVKNVK